MIEIIAGAIVLILAIIGIAKLVKGRGGGGGGGTYQDMISLEKAVMEGLEKGFKNPSALYAAIQNAFGASGQARNASATIGKRLQIYGEKVDAAVAYSKQPLEDQISAAYGIQDIARFARKAIAKYRRGEIKTPEEFIDFLKNRVEIEKAEFQSDYKLGHAGLD
jgi:hypothetical protein